MQIIIDGCPAVLKEGSSFDYIAENRLFSGSDAYTLSITFPLRDCPRNIEIFGHAYRSDATIPKFVFDCEIRDRSFSKFGTLTIVEISETEVKAQFLEGRSEQNFAANFEKTYVNELDLGKPANVNAENWTPDLAWDGQALSYECVALPWVSAESGISHNFADYNESTGSYSWADGVTTLSWQPYLLFIAKKICNVIGYSHDFSSWENHPFLSKILICNTLPESWDMPDYARALPHWTVDEFFEKLELFLAGEFDIDHRARKITFAFSRDVLFNTPPVRLDSVIDEFSSDVKTDGADCDYLESKNLSYRDPGHQMWKYYSCDWFVKDSTPVSYPDIVSLLNANSLVWDGFNHRGSNMGKILYVENLEQPFIIRAVSRKKVSSQPSGDVYSYRCVLQPVNEFGDRIIDIEDDDSVEMEFVPACIDYTDDKYWFCLFLNFSSYSETSGAAVSSDPIQAYNDAKAQADVFQKPGAQQRLETGEKGEKSEYYSVVNVAYYDGTDAAGHLPYPLVSNVHLNYDTHQVTHSDFSLRLNDKNPLRTPVYVIDPTRRVTFKFLSDNIPSPRALFYIRGKRYVCEKITATFTESGMSQLMKGEFFPLLDN